MAISVKSKILASDINTALSGKQDALGYIPVKSVNGVSADAAGNVAVGVIPNYSAGVDFSSGYTAPSDGVIVCSYWYNNGVFRVAANNTYIVGGGSNGVVYEVNYITTSATPVKKGNVLTLWTQGTITVNMKFYPIGA